MKVQHVTGRVKLKRGRERAVLNRHPWVFDGAIESIDGDVHPGDVVDVVDANGKWLARGWVNPSSSLTVRLLTWDESERIDEDFIQGKLEAAIKLRERIGALSQTDAFRLVYSESDGLPGLTIDVYGEFVVIQASTHGIERWLNTILRWLIERFSPSGIIERSDTEERHREGLQERFSILYGNEPSGEVLINEGGFKFAVDILGGQKTGFYLDQRDNRRRCASYIGCGRVLNCFSYTGSFAIYALANGAEVATNIDTSEKALRLAGRNAQLNGFGDRVTNIHSNVFSQLRRFRDDGEKFDVVILDPPKLATKKSTIGSACRGYKDINLLAMKLLKPNGVLVTFSCSGLISNDLFQKVIFSAAVDARRDVVIVERLKQARDHPVIASFPESEYLKGFVCIVR
ncbi:MAG: class I SAM-dependent rRNA methyltransferase [Armatimonadota bacterium]|nr:class I SAM-dependent rRNA methyltransferase [Armatimonadota bacterium]MCX7778521.1 class I SAM-dependent rRNA methyltransferase [Armatimonadota bacterium]MDW8025818.1 class I SAM-dependent rRNA methyltransferase [Armatimonadota bacterium]